MLSPTAVASFHAELEKISEHPALVGMPVAIARGAPAIKRKWQEMAWRRWQAQARARVRAKANQMTLPGGQPTVRRTRPVNPDEEPTVLF